MHTQNKSVCGEQDYYNLVSYMSPAHTSIHPHTRKRRIYIDRHSSVHKHPVNPIELRIKALKAKETMTMMMKSIKRPIKCIISP